MHFLGLSPLHLLSLILLLQGVLGATPLSYSCSNSSNTSNANATCYEASLNKLMSSLSHRVPRSGFGHVAVGKEPDRVFGLGLCRGDVSSADCKTCIGDAKIEILQSCPNDKEAIIWYNYCLLKYSNDNFFRKIDIKNKLYMYNTQNVSNPASFNHKVRVLLNQVGRKAYQSSKMYATRQLVVDGSEKLYGLAQCTRDLSRAHCKKCLDNAISDLPSCCDGK